MFFQAKLPQLIAITKKNKLPLYMLFHKIFFLKKKKTLKNWCRVHEGTTSSTHGFSLLTGWGDQLGPRDKIRLTANMVNVLCIFPAIDCGVMGTCLPHHVTPFFHSCGNCFACLCLSSFVSITLFNRTLKTKFVTRKIFVLNHALFFP